MSLEAWATLLLTVILGMENVGLRVSVARRQVRGNRRRVLMTMQLAVVAFTFSLAGFGYLLNQSPAGSSFEVPGVIVVVFSLYILWRGVAILHQSRGRSDTIAGIVVLSVFISVLVLGIMYADDQEDQRQLDRQQTTEQQA